MREVDFERILLRLNSSDAVGPLFHVVDSAARILDLPFVYIVARRPDSIVPIISSAPEFWNLIAPTSIPHVTRRLEQSVVVPEMTRDRDFANSDITKEPIAARYLASVPLPFRGLPFPVTLTTLGYAQKEKAETVISVLQGHATFAMHYLRLLLQNIVLQDDINKLGLQAPNEDKAFEAESPSVTCEFLTNTIIRQRRIRERKGQTFLSTATWRASIREEQLSALKVLKKHLPTNFIASFAADLASALTAVSGGQRFGYVTWVPCGNSGPRPC